MALYHNRYIRPYVNFFLKVALTDPGRWLISKFFARFDPLVYRWSKGRLTAMGPTIFPVLALTTTGRKTGKKRTVQLAYVAFDGNVYLVASNLGEARHPAWMHNMEANPLVSVQIGRSDYEVTAERLTEDEKAAVWGTLVEQLSNFDAYEKRSGRTLRVYRLPIAGLEPTI